MLQINNLTVSFGSFKAVDDVSLSIERGNVFGLVGESGSGKTLTALSIARLIPPQANITGGSIVFNGEDLMRSGDETLRGLRGSKIAYVFQEPASAFNPVFTIGYQLEEALLTHQKVDDLRRARETVFEYLEKVHIKDPKKVYHDYPHQLSGGTKQRIMIAMAILNSPELLILDEPTTALDVTIQSQILDLLDEIIKREKLSILFISHDFGVIARMCDHVAVMKKGRIVETGRTEQVLRSPRDGYTTSLLESVRELM